MADCTSLVPPPGGTPKFPPSGYGLPQSDGPDGPPATGVSLCDRSSKAKAISDLVNTSQQKTGMFRQKSSGFVGWMWLKNLSLCSYILWVIIFAQCHEQIGRFGKAFATSDLVKVNHSNRCGVTTSCSATLWQVLPSDPKCRGSSQESLPEGCEPGDNSANQGATLSFPDVMRWSCSNFGFVVATTVG